ncbi:unnamed protein product, partial [Dicrocoelium dendriticum]
MEFVYPPESTLPFFAAISTLEIHSQNLELRLSPHQIHSLLRLLEVFSAVHSETVDWSKFVSANFPSSNLDCVPSGDVLPPVECLDLKETHHGNQQQSWASWVWSLVPSILPPNLDLSDSDCEDGSNEPPANAIVAWIEFFDLVCEEARHQHADPTNQFVSGLQPSIDYSDSNVPPYNSSDVRPSSVSTAHVNLRCMRRNRRRIRQLTSLCEIPPLIRLCVRCDRLTIQLTLPDYDLQPHLIGHGSKRPPVRLQPTMEFVAQGLISQSSIFGSYFTSFQLGIKQLSAHLIGNHCTCGNMDECLSTATGTTDTLPNYGRVNEDGSVVLPAFAEFGTAHGCSSSQPPNDRFLFYSMFHSNSNVTLPGVLQNEQRDSPSNQCVLQLDSYFSKFTDTVVLEHYPALWFDLVNSMEYDAPTFKSTETARTSSLETRQFPHRVVIRLLSTEMQLHISASLLHRLEAVVASIRSHPNYPACSIDPSGVCERSEALSGQPQLTSFGGHVPIQMFRLATSSAHVHFHVIHSASQPVDAHSLILHLGPLECMHICPLHPEEITAELRHWDFVPHLIYHVNDLLSDDTSWLTIPPHPITRRAPDLDAAALLSHAFRRTRVRFHSCSVQMSPILSALNTPIATVSHLTVLWWNLNAPEQWADHPQAASISETEIRLYIQDQVAISLSATNLLFINFLLGPIMEQLRSFGDFLSKPAAAPVHSSPYLPASLMLQRLNAVHSARPIDLGTLCIEMPGSFHMHSSFNQLRWRFCMNLDGDLNAYLLCSGTNIVVIPVLQRLKQTEASVSHHPHSHGSRQSETTTSPHSTLFDLSLQFPSKLGQDSFSIPALCQIFVSGFAGTLSPYLIRWLSSVDLPPTMFDLEALRCDQMRNHSKSLPPASLTCPKPSVSLNPSFYQRTQSVHRYSCGHPNFAISPHASTIWPRFQTLPTENDTSSNTHADDWVHSRFTLIGIQELLKLLTVEVVLKPWKLTILRPDYDLTSAGSLSAGLTSDYCASVDFFSPEIVMDNSERNSLPYPATGQPDQPHIDPTRSGIPEAIKVAPPLHHPSTAHGFPSSMVPWRLRASRATVFVDRQMVFAVDLVASFLITSCQSPRGCGKFGSDQTCTTWCLHLEFSYDDPSDSPSKEDAAVSGIPSLEHILCVGQAVLYAFESLQSVAFKWTRLIRALRDLNNVDFSTTMNARISKHTDPILPSSVSNIVQKPIDIATPNSTVNAECFSKVVLATPVWSLTSNTPPLRFVVIGSLSHASGCFRTRSLDSVDSIVRWFVTDVAASIELQQRRFSLDLSVGALSVYLHQSGTVVPLLTPSGSWLRCFDDGDRHNPLPNGSFTNPMLSIEGSPFAGPNTIDSAEFQWVPRFPSETPCFTCTSQKCPKISPLEVTAPSDVMFAARLSISSGPQTHECSASTHSQHCDPLCSAYSTAVCGCPVVLLDAILQPLDVVIPLELIKCFEILDQWSTNSLPECHHAGVPCGQLEENSSVSFHGSYVIHPRLLVKLLRIFVIFAKDSRAYCTPSIPCEPNTLVLCSDNFEFRPLVDSQREHPTAAQSEAAERRQCSACIPNTSSLSSKNADRFTPCSAVTRGITCWMTEFASVLLPEEFIHYRWTELVTKRSDGPATLQQQYPAHYWNRGLLCASRKCHPHPAPGWLLIQSFSLTFSWAPTFPAMDLSSGSGSGSSLELLISDPLVLFADNTVVKALQTVLVSNITNSGRAESHGDFGRLKTQTSFLSRFFPQRLVIDLLHIRLTCWSDAMPDEYALNSFAQMVIDLNQAHLAVRLPAPNHLAIEASIRNTQMDLRFSGSHMPPSQSQFIGWSQFSPITPKEPHDSVVLILPPFPTDRVIARFSPPQMETVTFIGSAREKCDTGTGSATPFLTVCVTVDHVGDGDCALEPAVASNAARPDFVAHGKVIDITISVGNVAHAVVQPETLGAMVTLTKAVSSDTHELPMSYSTDHIDVEHSPSATSVLFRLAVQIDGLDLRILSASPRSDRGGELQLTLRQLTCDTLAVTNLGTLANSIKWRLTTSSVHLGCVSYHPISTADSSTLLSSRSISLLWPHTSLTCIGAARVAPCFHQLSSLTAPKYLTDLEIVVLLAAGCQTDVPLYGPTLDTLIHIILSYSNNALLSVPLKQPVHSEFCFQCAGLQPIMHRDDLRQSLLGLSAWELTSLHALDSVRPTPISLHLDACWPWEPNHSNLSQAPLFAHPWPKVGQLVFCDNLRGEFQVSTDLRPCAIDVADEESESQWVGLTWAYPEPRTPVHLRVIPIPLCFIERYSPSAFPQGLQLPCYLQYWDHSQLPRGSFVTYATFSLRDNQAVDVFLMNTRRFHKSYLDSTGEASHSNHMGSHLWRQVRDNLDSLIHQSSCSSEFPTPVWSDIHRDDPDLFDLDGSDSTPAEQIWRILVDLRARPAPVFQSPSSAHGTFHATTVTSSEPVALVHISPLALGGSVELDSVQKRSIIPNAGLRGQIYCPSLRCSVVQQTYSSNSIWTANSELARLEFSNLLFSLAHPLEHWTLVSPQHVITLSWAHSLLSIADPNWSCTQPILSVQSFHGAFQLSDRGRPADIKVRSSDVHLFVGVDRLHNLNCLHSVVKHVQQRLAHLVDSSECSFNTAKLVTLPPLHWLVINHSDQIIFLQQLGSRTHSTSFKVDSSRDIQTTDPFLMEIRPSECVPWRPILLPGFCPNSSIRLRFGIKR